MSLSGKPKGTLAYLIDLKIGGRVGQVMGPDTQLVSDPYTGCGFCREESGGWDG